MNRGIEVLQTFNPTLSLSRKLYSDSRMVDSI